ncbi:zinc ABC transporter solute-binding protein [Weissella coleopterorum]|uniref:Zinc ABC transporter solute-binding protein n=1 Tax=Weissella coleopterorum TaxID=2714949 RepID=A0A6G8AYJ4_9LACO|nr:zinc ABC transporter substrate-binding protein [Weissella coleopterorum]QIL50050.1 zinc ABC transporter solute-binding protein [Weissella coleopterorum]
MTKQRNRRYWMVIPVVTIIILLGLIFHRTWQNEQRVHKTNTAEKIRIVTSLAVYGEMAQAVVGDQGQVQSIINKASVDPHEYEPSVQTAKAYAQAQLIIANGAGYDAWSTKFAQANTQAQKLNVGTIVGYHEGDNEHFWYQPTVTKAMMDPLVDKLSALKPASRSYFQTNAQRYIKTIQPLAEKRAELTKQLKGKSVLVTEPVYDNALAGLGVHDLNPNFAHAIEAGNDPNPTDVLAWNDAITQGQVAFVINNPQTENAVTRRAVKKAQQFQVPIISVTETKPDGKNYLEWQLGILEQIEEALKK